MADKKITINVDNSDENADWIKRVRDENAKKEKEEKERTKWPQDMLIPCRSCTDKNAGGEVRKPLDHFTIAVKVATCGRSVWLKARTCRACVANSI